jgi:MoaA/NifB/PqqE/SkfB family radical SAM enzyme
VATNFLKKTPMSTESRGPGLWESLKGLLPGGGRKLDCVQVEVTSRCMGRCVYCPHTVFKERWYHRDMPMETFRRLWPLMRRARRVHLQGWGEPLLNPAFFEMAALARRAGCAVSTTSCGLGLTEQQAESLVESGLDVVAFSLTGTDAESNAARAGIPFAQVFTAIERLQTIRRARRAVHMEIHFAYLLLASNLASVRALPALMQRLGVHVAVISTLDYLPAPALAGEAFFSGKTEKFAAAEAILAETAAAARRHGQGFDYALPHWDFPGPGCRENIGRTLFVSAEGDLSPCVYVNIPAAGQDDRRRTFGNVNSEDPVVIWKKPALRAFIGATASGEPDPVCRTCPKRFIG